MGYSKNPATVRKIEKELQSLARGQPTSWTRPDEISADRWAYKVHEALWIAARNPGLFPGLAQAHKSFSIVVEGNVVRATVRPTTEIVGVDPPVVSAELSPRSASRTLAGASSVEEIVQFWLNAQPTNDELVLVDAYLTNPEFNELVKWSRGLTPAWEVFHVKGTATIILRPSRIRAPNPSPMPIRSATVGGRPEPEVPG